MPSKDKTQNTLVTYSVLTGLTPLIPVPFVDDQVYAYFFRSMVRQLALVHGVTLSAVDINTLTTKQGNGCPLGCIASLLLYPFQKIFRKVFFFLEWKRCADTISRSYYEGYLIDTVLQQGWLKADIRGVDGEGIDTAGTNAAFVRCAIHRVLSRTHTSLVDHAVSGVVQSSKGALKSASTLLRKPLPSEERALTEDNMIQDVADVEDEEKHRVGNVIGRLHTSFASIPKEHFAELQEELKRELGKAH